MTTMRRGEIRYYFKPQAVTFEYRKQFISYNCYSLQSHKKFNKFVVEIKASKRGELGTIDDLYGLARKYDLRAVKGNRPTIVGKIAF